MNPVSSNPPLHRFLWCYHVGRYPYKPEDGRENELAGGDVLRVVRGGSWGNGAGYARCASRFRTGPYFRSDVLGFRVVVAPPTSKPLKS